MIPKHTKCTNCGECCHFILATEKEIQAIRKFVKSHKIKPIKHKELGKCCFRDEANKKCLIYNVRPTICRLFGVAKGMECVNGNTADLDLRNELKTDKPKFLNTVRW